MSDELDKPDEAPIEIWNIDGELVPVRFGPRVIDKLLRGRMAECAAQQLAAELNEAQAQLAEQAERKPSPEEVLRRYNRRHGQNKRVTLKEVCEEMGVPYDNIRAFRSRNKKRKNKK